LYRYDLVPLLRDGGTDAAAAALVFPPDTPVSAGGSEFDPLGPLGWTPSPFEKGDWRLFSTGGDVSTPTPAAVTVPATVPATETATVPAAETAAVTAAVKRKQLRWPDVPHPVDPPWQPSQNGLSSHRAPPPPPTPALRALLERRRLPLVLDLDHTLLNSATFDDAAESEHNSGTRALLAALSRAEVGLAPSFHVVIFAVKTPRYFAVKTPVDDSQYSPM
jgi:hypothetical protein